MKRSSFIVLLAATSWLSLPVAPAGAAQEELTRTDRFPATAGKLLVIDVASLGVHVRAGDVTEIEVITELRISGVGEERAGDWVERHTPTFADSAEELKISATPGRSGFLGLGLLTARSRIAVVIPTSMIPDVTTTTGDIRLHGDFPLASPLRLRSSSGQIEFVGATGDLDIRSASGDVRIEVVRPLDRFFARTSSGDVSLTGGARGVEVDTASGNIWLANLSGPARVESATGKITLRWDRLDDDATVNVRSTSGRVTMVLPEPVQPGGWLKTVGGTIRSDLPGLINEQGDTVALQGDDATVKVECDSGEIVLTRTDL